jgi:hypothetical protein
MRLARSSAMGFQQTTAETGACIAAAKTQAPADARLLEYFGLGAQLAVTSGGMAIVAQADHLTEAVRLEDLALALAA